MLNNTKKKSLGFQINILQCKYWEIFMRKYYLFLLFLKYWNFRGFYQNFHSSLKNKISIHKSEIFP